MEGTAAAAHMMMAQNQKAVEQDELRQSLGVIPTDEEFFQCLAQELPKRCGGLVLFRRGGCPSCRHFVPKVQELAVELRREHGESLLCLELDAERCPRAARRYEVGAKAPTVVVFEHGKPREVIHGVSTPVLHEHVGKLQEVVASCNCPWRCGNAAEEEEGTHTVEASRL